MVWSSELECEDLVYGQGSDLKSQVMSFLIAHFYDLSYETPARAVPLFFIALELKQELCVCVGVTYLLSKVLSKPAV